MTDCVAATSPECLEFRRLQTFGLWVLLWAQAIQHQSVRLHCTGMAPSGASFLLQNSQTGGSALAGVAALSANDVWAVGLQNSTGSVSQTMVQHWDGTIWTIFPSQSPGSGLNDLNYVAATPTGKLWAVGAYFNTPYNYRTLVERPDYTCGMK